MYNTHLRVENLESPPRILPTILPISPRRWPPQRPPSFYPWAFAKTPLKSPPTLHQLPDAKPFLQFRCLLQWCLISKYQNQYGFSVAE